MTEEKSKVKVCFIIGLRKGRIR